MIYTNISKIGLLNISNNLHIYILEQNIEYINLYKRNLKLFYITHIELNKICIYIWLKYLFSFSMESTYCQFCISVIDELVYLKWIYDSIIQFPNVYTSVILVNLCINSSFAYNFKHNLFKEKSSGNKENSFWRIVYLSFNNKRYETSKKYIFIARKLNEIL